MIIIAGICVNIETPPANIKDRELLFAFIKKQRRRPFLDGVKKSAGGV